MFTVATTHRFEKDAAQIWSEAEIDELIAHISADPNHGDLIPGTGGLRKHMSAATLVKLKKELIDG